jgi:RNA polymerase sigma-70 factor, ECF subfamily
MPSPRMHIPRSGCWYPSKRFASPADPRQEPGRFPRRVPRFDVHWNGASEADFVSSRITVENFVSRPLSRNCWHHSIKVGCRIAATYAQLGASVLQFHQFDEAYLERLCSGEFRTENHFVAYFSELIQLKLRSRVNSPQAVEDLRQETFVRVFVALRSAGRLRQPERLGAFVNSVCNNVLLEYYRSASRDNSAEEEDGADVPDPSLDVVAILSHKEMQQKVRQVLDELSERDRRLLREIFLEERDKDAVCRDFQVDRDYLRVLLHRAKQAFKAVYLKKTPTPA